MGTAVLASAGFSFLGPGIQPSRASLGLVLSNARSFFYSGEWWFSVFPENDDDGLLEYRRK